MSGPFSKILDGVDPGDDRLRISAGVAMLIAALATAGTSGFVWLKRPALTLSVHAWGWFKYHTSFGRRVYEADVALIERVRGRLTGKVQEMLTLHPWGASYHRRSMDGLTDVVEWLPATCRFRDPILREKFDAFRKAAADFSMNLAKWGGPVEGSTEFHKVGVLPPFAYTNEGEARNRHYHAELDRASSALAEQLDDLLQEFERYTDRGRVRSPIG